MASTWARFVAAIVSQSAERRRFLLIIAVLLGCAGQPASMAWTQPDAALPQPQATSQEGLRAGQVHAGFQVVAQYIGHREQLAGLRLTHMVTGTPVHLLQLDTVPQAAVAVHTYPDSDRGAAHALEHLLIGKGTTGRRLQALADMRLGRITASTGERYTWYHFSVDSGLTSFHELLGQLLEALFRPDFSDLEAEQEVYHLGVAPDLRTGQQRLIEQGTVYTEMRSSEGAYDYWYALLKQLLGTHHPQTFPAGGTPEGIRGLTVQEIRRFHQDHYVVGPTTPLILVVARQQDPLQVLAALSERLTALNPPQMGRKPVAAATERTRIAPTHDRTLQFVPLPGQSASDPAHVVFGWPPAQLPSLPDRLLLEVLLAVFGQGNTSRLYRSLVDSQTRELGVGATGVESLLLPTYERARPIGLVWIEGMPGDQLTRERLEALRGHIQAELRAVAGDAEYSPELLAFNEEALAYLTARQRSLHVWHTQPPGFGQRGLEPLWMEHLQVLDGEAGERRSLVWQSVWPQLRSAIGSGRNFWRPLIERAGLLEKPYGSAAIPSPALRERLTQAQDARLAAAMAELRALYGGADDQEVLRRFTAAQQRQGRRPSTESQALLSRFTATPPRTFDDSLPYASATIADVPAMFSSIAGLAVAEIGLAFDLRGLPPRLYRYLPLLPGLLRSLGWREDGVVTTPQMAAAHMQRHLYRLEANYRLDPAAGRYELVLKASGVGLEEFTAALAYLRRMTHDNDVSAQNLPRLNDLLQQQLHSERTFAQRPEEEWLETLAQAFRHQDDHLYLSLSAPPTRAHHLQRLAWLLAGPLPEETLADLQTFAAQHLASLRGLSGAALEQRLAEIQETGWRGRLADSWRAHLQAWPAALAWEGLQRLSTEALNDLQVGHTRAIQELRELQSLVLDGARLRLWLVGDPGVIADAQPHIEALVQSFPRQMLASSPRHEASLVWKRLRQRQPGLQAGYPAYVGYVQEGTVTGSVMVTARGPRYLDDDESSLVDMLAAKVLAGTGPHTWYKQTWEAGLAYGNGLDLRPRTGTLLYYADRSPSVRATLAFVRSRAQDLSWLSEPAYVDYALAQAFNFSRSAQPWTARAEAMAIDLAEGLTPAHMRRFSQQALALRQDPGLLERLRAALPHVVARVIWGRGEDGSQAAAQTLFFVVAPEPQLAELEADLRGKPLARVWPSDFWLD
jgi:Zn-dependent M16 (insulinase) family peptidase